MANRDVSAEESSAGGMGVPAAVGVGAALAALVEARLPLKLRPNDRPEPMRAIGPAMLARGATPANDADFMADAFGQHQQRVAELVDQSAQSEARPKTQAGLDALQTVPNSPDGGMRTRIPDPTSLDKSLSQNRRLDGAGIAAYNLTR